MWMVMLITGIAYSQNTFSARILDSETKEALAGASASIDSLRLHSSADENGLVTISNIPDGTYEIEFSFLGYNENVTIVCFLFQFLTGYKFNPGRNVLDRPGTSCRGYNYYLF